jgi:diphthine-ammonia ligase
MIDSRMDAKIVKICCMGLKPQMLGKSIQQLQAVFMKLEQQFGFNVCGEGGEYESAVVDCPLFKHRLVLKES